MARAFTHYVRYLLGIDPAQTQTTQAERDAVSKYALGKKRAVEIGVFEGVTTGVIAQAVSEAGELFAVDPFIAGRIGICWGKPIAKREVRRKSARCNIHFVERFSHEAAQAIDGMFDFAFIDGDHSLEGIQKDWSDWSSRIEPAGIIALHDTIVPEHNPRVAQLGSYQYFISHIQYDDRFQLVAKVDSLSVLQRKSA